MFNVLFGQNVIFLHGTGSILGNPVRTKYSMDIYLEYTPELVEAGGVSCDTTPLDTEGVVIGVETDIIHLTVANNWTNTDGGVFLRHVHPSTFLRI